jgi:GNAT superfamily N-acetyltransferase
MAELSKIVPDPDDYRWCHLRFAERTVPLEDYEPSRFVQEYGGTLEWEDPEDRTRKATLGTFRAYLVDIPGAITEGESIDAVWDTSQSTWSAYEALFDGETAELTDVARQTAFGTDYQHNSGVLIIDRLAILPEYRGYCVGLLAMKVLIEQFRAASGVVVIKPFPLQFEGDSPVDDEWPPRAALHLDSYSQSMRAALAKLKRYYARLGFESVRGTEYMVLDPSLELVDYDKLIAMRSVRRKTQRN